MSRKTMLMGCFTLCMLIAAFAGTNDLAVPYVEVQPGTLPIILLAPHAGTLKPDSAKTRTSGNMAPDVRTEELTRLIADELEQQYKGRPHVILCLMHRSKVDCNRDLPEATDADPLSTEVWKRFHGAANKAAKQLEQKHGAGLVLDIHGQRHEDKRVEFGYLVSSRDLNRSDKELDQDRHTAQITSVRELVERSPDTLSELIRGPRSLGTLLEQKGFRSIPGTAKPGPGDQPYYSGSYNLVAHGSRDGGTISAIQVECPWEGVRDTDENRRRFAKALVEVLGPYFEAHFSKPLSVR